MHKKMTISILGCGWFGLPFGAAAIKNGYRVKGSTTQNSKLDVLAEADIKPYLINLDEPITNEDFFDCEVLWIAVPPRTKQQGGDNYLIQMQNVLPYIIRHNIKQVVFISSTGVYNDDNEKKTELTIPNASSASGKILIKAENLFKNNSQFTTTIIRFAGLIGPGRNPGRFFAGKSDIPNGQAPVNLIHLNDCVGIALQLLSPKAMGITLNACAPQHPEKQVYYKQMARQAGLPEPQFTDELNSWKIVESDLVTQMLNYTFTTSIFDV